MNRTTMKPRALLVTAVPPHPPTTGGAQRTNLIHRALARIADVDLFLLRDRREFPADDLASLESRFGLVACVPRRRRGEWLPWSLARRFAGARVDRVAHHLGSVAVEFRPDPRIAQAAKAMVAARRYDFAVARYLTAAAKCDLFDSLPVLLDVDDLDLEVVASRVAASMGGAPGGAGRVSVKTLLRRTLERRHLRQLQGIVDPLLRRCAGHWIAKEADRTVAALEHATLLRNIPFEPESTGPVPATHPTGASTPARSPAASTTLLTVGTLTHRPNAEGIDRFLRDSWPDVVAAVPAARLRIVGGGLAEEQRRRWGAVEGVEVVGFVDDLEEEYAACAATLCAVHAGGGSNIKISESYRRGRAAVVAAHSMRGYESILEDRSSVWVGRSDRELSEGCIALLRDPTLRDRMAEAGRAACAKELSFERFAAAVAERCADVLKAPRAALARGPVAFAAR
ncbi:MAG TPA: glycosyltransferase [Phycisphaerales bacterium]|nr:glycosyltransferase [Phycisphaerales bacterium]HMP36446.1 glycosyltransferase [Phycisphaerales bacterium]